MGKVTRLGAGRNGDGRASFVAHMQKIRELVEAGYTARTIHEQHGAAMRISYRQFMRYFNEYIGPKRIKGKKTPQADGPEKTGTSQGGAHTQARTDEAKKADAPKVTEKRKQPFELVKLDPSEI
jgi:hypothetical protein